MPVVSEMFDFLRDQLNDPDDSQVPFLTKKRYLNLGIARLWPDIYRIDSWSIVLEEGVYDYLMDSALAYAYLISVERQSSDGSDDYLRYNQYDIIPGDEVGGTGYFRITGRHPGDGIQIRFTAAQPIGLIESEDYGEATDDVWEGPSRALNLPALYAMAMCTLRKVDDRQDTYRYSTTQATNGVGDRDMTSLAQMWLAQFELEVENFARPLPLAKD